MINIIVATSDNNVIGFDGSLPWSKQKSDLKRFRSLTIDHPVIMGRKTYDSITFDLDRRHQLVLTKSGVIGHNQNFCGCMNTTVFSSSEEALNFSLKMDKDVFIIGGSEIYNIFLPLADRIFRTVIHKEANGDAFFYIPEYYTLIEENSHSSDINNEHAYTFQLFERT
jgi:dihydrofolate reductase